MKDGESSVCVMQNTRTNWEACPWACLFVVKYRIAYKLWPWKSGNLDDIADHNRLDDVKNRGRHRMHTERSMQVRQVKDALIIGPVRETVKGELTFQ